mmetsp:Transcript_16314/g.18702  ORF Transcript_16314/g.18702 Transcript_16314/m.18702 type:complete len:106 (-) Transcript_16314:561-878(-)
MASGCSNAGKHIFFLADERPLTRSAERGVDSDAADITPSHAQRNVVVTNSTIAVFSFGSNGEFVNVTNTTPDAENPFSGLHGAFKPRADVVAIVRTTSNERLVAC